MCFGVPPSQFSIIKSLINLCQLDIIPIDLISDDNILKLHLITGQSPRLISEHILDLPQLLINTDRMTLHPTIIDETKHLLILAHGVPLEHFHELQGDDQTDGDVGAVQDEVGPERNAGDLATVGLRAGSDHFLEGDSLQAG